VRKGVDLTGGAYLAVTWERWNVVDGLPKLEEETPFGKYAKAAQAEWVERVHGGLRGEAGWGCSGLGRMGRNQRKNYFRIKFEFLNIQRLWKFAQGDLGGILTWVFFLNSSRLLKDFRKMIYAMPCYVTLGKIN
jgi:hypothetical protein